MAWIRFLRQELQALLAILVAVLIIIVSAAALMSRDGTGPGVVWAKYAFGASWGFWQGPAQRRRRRDVRLAE